MRAATAAAANNKEKKKKKKLGTGGEGMGTVTGKMGTLRGAPDLLDRLLDAKDDGEGGDGGGMDDSTPRRAHDADGGGTGDVRHSSLMVLRAVGATSELRRGAQRAQLRCSARPKTTPPQRRGLFEDAVHRSRGVGDHAVATTGESRKEFVSEYDMMDISRLV